jgi:predicted transcriptional regulator
MENKDTLNLSGTTVPEFRQEVRKIVEANANDKYMQATFNTAYEKIKEQIGDSVTYPDDEVQSLVEVFNTNLTIMVHTMVRQILIHIKQRCMVLIQ